MKFPRFGKGYDADSPKERECVPGVGVKPRSIRDWGIWSSPMGGAIKGVITVVVLILVGTLMGYGLWFLFGALGMQGEERALSTTLASVALLVGAGVGYALECD